MSKTWMITLLFVLGSHPLSAGQQTCGLSLGAWGLSQTEVRSLFAAPPVHEQHRAGLSVLSYEARLLSHPSTMSLFLVDDRLVRVRYTMTPRGDHEAQLAAYRKITAALEQSCGSGEEQTEWRDTRYQDDVSEWGRAIAYGHLLLASTWRTDTTKIVATIKGGELEITTEVEYFFRFTRSDAEQDSQP